MATGTDEPRHDGTPTREQIAEELLASDIRALIRAWRAAGKPRKR